MLESGEELGADMVISSAGYRATFKKLLEPGTLDPEFRAEVYGTSSGGSRAR